MDRYHIEWSIDPDMHPGMAAYGPDTVGITDNTEGGVILYCHVDSAAEILGALMWQERARPKED